MNERSVSRTVRRALGALDLCDVCDELRRLADDELVSGAEGVGSVTPGATTDTALAADTAVGTPPPNTTDG